MKNKNKNKKQHSSMPKLVMTITIIMMVGTLLGAVGYLATRIPCGFVAENKEFKKIVRDDINNWQVYSDEKYNFQVKYPKDISDPVAEESENAGNKGIQKEINFKINDDWEISIFIWNMEASEKDDLAKAKEKYDEVFISGNYSWQSKQNNNADDNKDASSAYFFETYLYSKTHIYQIEYKGIYSKENFDLYQKMISTFKFIEKDETDRIITQKSVSLSGKEYKFVHSCTGIIKQAKKREPQLNSVFYCLGENKLVFIGPDGKTLDIKSEKITDMIAAPVLIDAQLLSSVNRDKIVLVSYSPNPCLTIGDCGVGEPTNFVTIAFNISKNTFRNIKNYPEVEIANWNKSGTKAVFYPHTCGGAGCDIRSLVGYNLLVDEAKNITTEQAAWDRWSGCEDEIPCWSDLYWIDDNRVSATINYPDGSKKEVKASF